MAPAFLQHVKLQQLRFAARRNLHHRQTAAVHRHTSAQFDAVRDRPRPDSELNGTRRGLDAFDDACLFNNTCEHGEILRVAPDAVEP